jgi:hypothetical protein
MRKPKGLLRFLYILFFIVAAHNVGAQMTFPSTVRPYTFPSARATGLGGVHAAIADDFYTTLFFNPAGLATVKHEFSAVTSSFETIDIDLVFKVLGTDDSLSVLIPLMSKPFEADINIGGPLGLGRVGEKWGLGFFNVTRINLYWTPEDIFTITPTITEEMFAKGGYGLRVFESRRYSLDIGLAASVNYRFGFNGPSIYLNEVKYVLEDMIQWPVESQLGVGFDAGLIFTIDGALFLGAAIYDAYSPTLVTVYRSIDQAQELMMIDNKWIPIQPRASAGFAWKVKSPFLHRYISDLIFSFDFQGLLGNMQKEVRDPILDLSACFEIKLHEVLTLRASLSEMLPGAGLSFDWTFMQIDFSFFGKEQGPSIGSNSTYAISLDCLFRY